VLFSGRWLDDGGFVGASVGCFRVPLFVAEVLLFANQVIVVMLQFAPGKG
jgi:hypothetical protein